MKFEFYREGKWETDDPSGYLAVNVDKGDWRWRLKSNGRIVAEGGEGYQRSAKMLSALRSIFKDSPQRLREIEAAWDAARRSHQ